MTVQLPPGRITTPLAQVPPVSVKPAGAPAFNAGAAVNVNGPAVAPVAVLFTVTVPLFVVVLAVVVVNAGVGAVIAIVA